VKTAPVPGGGGAESRYESFASTRWSIVLEAGNSATVSVHAFNALSELCQIYWRPLYSFYGDKGCSAEDAQDLIQGFFADLIETRAYARADREKGRFRSFLLGTLKHFVADVHDHGRALKRGGGMILTSLDDQATAEAEAQIARATKWQPEEVYDREWAALLLRQALDRLTQECALTAKADLLSHLMPYLSTTEESDDPVRTDGPTNASASRHIAQRRCSIAQAVSHDSTRSSARHGVRKRRRGRRTAIFVPGLTAR
jgi:RNA polymerase sigma-70 factor (ECF subfamily)